MAQLYDLEIDPNADTSHTRVIQLTGSGKRVLEFGCASGYVAKILGEQHGCTVTGIELVPESAAKARQVCHRVICGDAETLDYARELDGEQFDVVLFGDVLEHLRDPAAVLSRVRDFIAPDGYVVASIPNIAHASVALELIAGRFRYRPFGLLDDTHLRFFNRRSIRELFESTGYLVAALGRIEMAPGATEFRTRLADFPREMVEFALAQDEATTYQFIVKAHPSTEAGTLEVLRARIAELETARRVMGERDDARLASVQKELEAARELAEGRAVEIAHLAQALHASQAAASERDAALEERRTALHAETTRAARLQQRLDGAQQVAAARGARVARLEQQLQSLLQARADLEAATTGLRSQLGAMSARVESILGSRSWTFTAPARRAASALAVVREIGLSHVAYWALTRQLRGRLRLRREAALVIEADVFDRAWYHTRSADVAEANVDALAHYLQSGAQEGRSPSALFDTTWYLAQYPDVAAAGINPLVHYLQSGAAEARDPHPLFRTSWYLARYPDVASAGINPLAHYLRYGGREGRDPSPLFDGSWYLTQYPDVAAAGTNPLAHYLDSGAGEGRDPGPLFDTSWYLAQYPDVAATGMNPLVHYVETGAAEGRDPSPYFDSSWYLERNADVAAAGTNPLEHYVLIGAAEGRHPRPPHRPAAVAAEPPAAVAPEDVPVSPPVPDRAPARPGAARTPRVRGADPAPTPRATPSSLRGGGAEDTRPLLVQKS